jgi:DNA-damage-inducible protein J
VFNVSITTITIRVDSDVKKQAQSIFASLGLDMTTAINVFLHQAIQTRGIPFSIVEQAKTPAQTPHLGGWEGKVWMADDFDAPLDDFREYMG